MTVPSPLWFLVSLTLVTAPVAATPQRSFVASTGSDANASVNCTLTMPCRSFAAAVAATTAGGEVVVLDSAGYGRFTVTKSMSIIAPLGVHAGISVSQYDQGVVVLGGGLTVTLRGLTINGEGGAGGLGIVNDGTNALYVENCVIANLGGGGIYNTGRLYVSDTVIRNASIALRVRGAGATGVLDRVRLEQNERGLSVEDGGTAAMTDSIAAGNALFGVQANVSSGSASSSVKITRSVVAHNREGVDAISVGLGVTARVEISASTISDNDWGFRLGGFVGGTAIISSVHNTIATNNVGIDVQDGSRVLLDSTVVTQNATGISSSGTGLVYSRDNSTVIENTTNVIGSSAISPTPVSPY